jgi:hypothetical protein
MILLKYQGILPILPIFARLQMDATAGNLSAGGQELVTLLAKRETGVP